MKAVIYARQSSGDAVESLSVDVQIKACQDLAKQHGIDVIGVFQDLNTSGEIYPSCGAGEAKLDKAYQAWRKEQLTAKKEYRHGLSDALAQVKDVDYIIVNEITRLYRPVNGSYLSGYVDTLLKNHNVKVLQVQGGTIDFNSVSDSLITQIKNQILFEDLQKKRSNSIRGKKERKDRGEKRTKAYGAIYDTATKEISFDSEKAEAVKYIFDAIASYKTYTEILHTLNSKYYHLATGKLFYETNLYNTVKNAVYCGYMENSTGELIECKNVHGAFISLALYLKANDVVKEKKEASGKARFNRVAGVVKNHLPYSGLIRCSNCGSKMVVLLRKGEVHYRCKRALLQKDADCNCCSIRASGKANRKGEKLFLNESLRGLLISNVIDRQIAYSTIRNIDTETDAIKAKIENLKSVVAVAFEMFTDGTYDAETYRAITKKNMAKVKLLENDLLKLKAEKQDNDSDDEARIIRDMANLESGLPLGNDVEMELVRKTFDSIVAYPKHITVNLKNGLTFDLPRLVYERLNIRYMPTSKVFAALEGDSKRYLVCFYASEKAMTNPPNANAMKTLAANETMSVVYIEE